MEDKEEERAHFPISATVLAAMKCTEMIKEIKKRIQKVPGGKEDLLKYLKIELEMKSTFNYMKDIKDMREGNKKEGYYTRNIRGGLR